MASGTFETFELPSEVQPIKSTNERINMLDIKKFFNFMCFPYKKIEMPYRHYVYYIIGLDIKKDVT